MEQNSIGVAGRLTSSARSVQVNLSLLRAFRRSPIDFLDGLLANGAAEVPLRVGSERVMLLDDPAQVWELLTVHTRRTQKGRGIVRARLLLRDGLLTSEGPDHMRHQSRHLGHKINFATMHGRRRHLTAPGDDLLSNSDGLLRIGERAQASHKPNAKSRTARGCLAKPRPRLGTQYRHSRRR